MQLLRLLALLLLLCVSGSRAASLIHARQALEETEAPEAPAPAEEAPAQEPLEAGNPAAETPVVDDPVVEAPSVDSPVEEAAAEDIPAAETPEAADAPLETQADSPAEEEPLAADSPVQSEEAAQDTPAEDSQVAADEPAPDSPAEEAPAGEDSVMDAPVDAAEAPDTPASEEVPGDAPVEDKMAADAPADEPMLSDAPADEPMLGDAPADDPMLGDAPAEETLTDQATAADVELAADVPVDGEAGMMMGEEPTESLPADLPVDTFPLEDDDDDDIMSPLPPSVQATAEGDWGINSIRQSFQAVNGYFDSLVEMMGGRNGVCQYRCRHGKTPTPRIGYTMPEPNGCSSSLLGFEFDMGIPAMTKCCNQLDVCYDTCGSNKNRCDSKFRWCLHGICSDLKKSLGFVSKVEVCESMADAMYNTVWTLGCRSYMSSQRAACFCEGEERDEL